MVTNYQQNGSRFGPKTDYLRCVLLVFVLYDSVGTFRVVLDFSVFPGKGCRPTDRWDENNERINAKMSA